MSTFRRLDAAAFRVARALEQHGVKLVLAESCTGGLVSAALTGVPGISDRHCGSAVVYRIETKAEWLGISRALLETPGPVSYEVAAAMACGVLEKTPEAHLSAAVTGHLGPGAPPDQDGLVYVATARRQDGTAELRIAVAEHRLPITPFHTATSPRATRRARQRAAALLVLEEIHRRLESEPDAAPA